MDLQAAPVGEKTKGAAAAAVQAVQEEATPSHDVYGHLPKPEENDKASSADRGGAYLMTSHP
jgi:predicted phosphohydrolase